MHPMLHWARRACRILAAAILASGLVAQQISRPAQLHIVIVEGGGAVNNIRERVAREPIVQVEDENRRPVAGAVVVFLLPNQGAGGSFAGGAASLTVTTDEAGRAVAHGFRPNSVAGEYSIRVRASYQGLSAGAEIRMINAAGAAAGGGLSTTTLVVLAGAAAAVAGVVLGVTRGGNGGTAPSTTISVAPGTPSVGPPRP